MVAAVMIDLWIIYYLWNLQKIKCLCALEWRHTVILFYWTLSMLYTVAHIFKLGSVVTNPALSTFMITFSIFNIWVVLSYIKRLEEEKCKCSEHVARDVIKIITIVRMFMYVFVALVAIYSLLRLSNAIHKSIEIGAPKQGRRGRRGKKGK